MAQIDIMAPFILSHEGGYVNHPMDKGGPTNKGVTLGTWKKYGRDINGDGIIDENDLKLISDDDAIKIMKRNYWDAVHADDIESQSVANLLVDWVWGSGTKQSIPIVQEMVGAKADGIIGPQTIAAINAQDSKEFFDKLHARRHLYFNRIVENNPDQETFLNGWRRRLDSIQFESLKCNDKKGTVIRFDDKPNPPETETPVGPTTPPEDNKPKDENVTGSIIETIIRLIASLFKK